MTVTLSKEAVEDFLEYYLNGEKYKCDFKWELTDDLSKDPDPAPEEFPYVILKDGKFFDAITERYAKELLKKNNS